MPMAESKEEDKDCRESGVVRMGAYFVWMQSIVNANGFMTPMRVHATFEHKWKFDVPGFTCNTVTTTKFYTEYSTIVASRSVKEVS